MAATYALWDAETGNVVAWFDSEDDALATVRDALGGADPESAETLFLSREDEDGQPSLIAEGPELIARAEALPSTIVARTLGHASAGPGEVSVGTPSSGACLAGPGTTGSERAVGGGATTRVETEFNPKVEVSDSTRMTGTTGTDDEPYGVAGTLGARRRWS